MNKFSYSLGIIIAQNLKQQGVDGDVVAADLADAVAAVLGGQPTKINPSEAQQVVQQELRAQAAAKYESVVAEGQQFLAKNGQRPEVVTLPSGLQYEILKTGEGPRPQFKDKVTTHYHGTLIDGRVFDSSVERGTPTSFPVNGVIPGWTEALQLMPVGSKWKLFVPYNLAYGERSAGDLIGPFSTLVFEVELLSIN
ncbi:MAG: FKBP-type peptidyl-prolyl cis-trans isomerase [Bacteroidota bacterium]